MFETLHMITDEQVKTAAETLNRGIPVFFLVDKSGVHVVFRPAPNRDMDFNCLTKKDDK